MFIKSFKRFVLSSLYACSSSSFDFAQSFCCNFSTIQTTITRDTLLAKPYNWSIKANIYLLKVNNINTRKTCEICSKLTKETPEWCLDVLVSLLLTFNISHTLF